MTAAERSVDDYLLPEDENRRIFHQEIVPDKMWGLQTQDDPVVVFLVGQPGAGKSRVSAMVATVLNARGGFVDIDSDLYKPYHPSYDALMAEDDKLMAAFTRADGRAWMARAHQYVRDHKLNAVIQETSQNGQAVAETMTAYRRAGFRVEVLAMGVSKAMSDQGIVARYHEQVKDRGSGRLTVQKNADESYRGILELASLIDRDRLADQVGVFRRGEGTPRYANGLDEAGAWRHPAALAAAVETERTRPWGETETRDFLRTQGRLRREMGAEWNPTLTRIDRLALPQMQDTATYAYWTATQSIGAIRDPMQPGLGSTTTPGPPGQRQAGLHGAER